MIIDQLSDFAEIFNQSDLSFRANNEALFITDEHELITIGKDNTFKVISQVALASCVQRNHVYMCDRHQVLGNDLADTCLGALQIRSEPGVQKHCRFERKIVQELVYQTSDLDHLIYSPQPQVHTMYCKNGTRKVLHLDQATKVRVDTNCHVKLTKHKIMPDIIVMS